MHFVGYACISNFDTVDVFVIVISYHFYLWLFCDFIRNFRGAYYNEGEKKEKRKKKKKKRNIYFAHLPFCHFTFY